MTDKQKDHLMQEEQGESTEEITIRVSKKITS
jgi:hypothetical protein